MRFRFVGCLNVIQDGTNKIESNWPSSHLFSQQILRNPKAETAPLLHPRAELLTLIYLTLVGL